MGMRAVFVKSWECDGTDDFHAKNALLADHLLTLLCGFPPEGGSVSRLLELLRDGYTKEIGYTSWARLSIDELIDFCKSLGFTITPVYRKRPGPAGSRPKVVRTMISL